MELLALGPLELWHAGRRHPLGSVKERCALAVLVHARGEPVTMAAMVDRIWSEGDPPRTVQDTLQTYLSRLRGHLRAAGDAIWVERPSPRTYRLRAEPEALDLLRFQRLCRDAARTAESGDRAQAVALFRAAESLWRGEPLLEFTGDWAASTRARLAEDLRRAGEERIRLELELGRHAQLVGELRELAAKNPYAQRTVAALMLALYRCGRHDEALQVFRSARRRLGRDQGIEPGPDLRELHQRMLDQDPALLNRPPAAEVSPARPSRDNLPRAVPDFTGRAGELRILLDGPPADADGHALQVTVIHGMPGVGKTALALHAAHKLRASYPDGRFYIDLRGFGQSSDDPALDPAEALAVLLHAVGEADPLPRSLDLLSSRWREWTARHRALVVLDNARDAAQVSPLLPGAAGCRVVITSRNRLSQLEGTVSLSLDVLSSIEATALFRTIAGTARLAGAAGELAHVVDTCACHPLAVRLLASRFRHRDAWSLDHLVRRLTRTGDALNAPDSAVDTTFRLSYAEVAPPVRRVLRLLALHPGPDVTLEAAAALNGPSPAGGDGGVQLHAAIEELLDGHLVEEHVPDRYRFHDLMRAFGQRMSLRDETTAARHEAVGRLLDHYLTAARRAVRLTHPHRRVLPPRGTPSPYAPAFADADEASAWLAVERANLLAVARLAAGLPGRAAAFPGALAPWFKLWAAWDVAAELWERAVDALRLGDDEHTLADALVHQADVLAQTDHDRALTCATEALTVFRQRGDTHGCADALLQSGRARMAAGDGARAHRLLDEAITLYRRVHDRHGEAECLNVQGLAHYRAGQYDEALARIGAMLAIHEELGDFHGQGKAWNNMGELHRLQNRYEDARDCYERSLALVQRHGGRQELAILDTNLADVYQATGQSERALASYRRALASHRAGNDTLGEVNVLIGLGTAYAQAGRSAEALLHLNMAEETARRIGNTYERVRALLAIADVQREAGQPVPASDSYHQALDLAGRIGFHLGRAHALEGLTRASLLSGRPDAAQRYGREALALYRNLDARTEEEGLLALFTDRRETGS